MKVDVQGVVGLAGTAAGGVAALAAAYHASLEASVAAHFPGNQCINCMCGSSEDLFRWVIITHVEMSSWRMASP